MGRNVKKPAATPAAGFLRMYYYQKLYKVFDCGAMRRRACGAQEKY